MNVPQAASSRLVGRFSASQPVRDVALHMGFDLDGQASKSAQERAESAICAIPKQVGDAVDLLVEGDRVVRARRDGVCVVGQHSVCAGEERELGSWTRRCYQVENRAGPARDSVGDDLRVDCY